MEYWNTNSPGLSRRIAASSAADGAWFDTSTRHLSGPRNGRDRETELEHRPTPPERGLRRSRVVSNKLAYASDLMQQMCRALTHDRDTVWGCELYPLRASQSNGGAAAVGSRRASARKRAGRREQRAPGTCRGPETVGLTDRSGGRGRSCRAALSDRSGRGRTRARSGLSSPGRPPVLLGGRPEAARVNDDRWSWE